MSKKNKKIKKLKAQFELLFCNQCGANISINDPLFVIELTNAALCSSDCLRVFKKIHKETDPGRFTVRYYEPATAAPVIVDEFSELTNEIWKAADVLKKLRNERKKDAPDIVNIQTEYGENVPRFWDNAAPDGEHTAKTKVNSTNEVCARCSSFDPKGGSWYFSTTAPGLFCSPGCRFNAELKFIAEHSASETAKEMVLQNVSDGGGAARSDKVKFESIEFADENGLYHSRQTEPGAKDEIGIKILELEKLFKAEIEKMRLCGVCPPRNADYLLLYFNQLLRIYGANHEQLKETAVKVSFDPNKAGREKIERTAQSFLDKKTGLVYSPLNLSAIMADFFISHVDEFRPLYISNETATAAPVYCEPETTLLVCRDCGISGRTLPNIINCGNCGSSNTYRTPANYGTLKTDAVASFKIKDAAARFLDSGQIAGEWKSEKDLSEVLTRFFIQNAETLFPYLRPERSAEPIRTNSDIIGHWKTACDACGRAEPLNRFRWKDFIFCSTQCRAAFSQSPKNNPRFRRCDGCGKQFPGGASVNADGVFCSQGCADNAINKQSVQMTGGAEME